MDAGHPHSTTTKAAPSNFPGASLLASARSLLRSAVPAVLIGTPAQVTEFLDLGRKSDKPIDDRKLAFSNGVKFMSKEGASSKWTAPLQETALALLHDPQRLPSGSGKADYVQRLPVGPVPSKACETVFHELLEAPSGSQRKKHPREISSLFYAYLNLISLSLYRTNLQDTKRNDASPYLDLSPLYGCTSEETEKIRLLDGRGMLAPDCFVDDRPSLLPPAVSALLVLWNRNHNFLAQSLFIRSGIEKQWVHHEDPSTAKCKKQDDEIFELARQINYIQFRNTVCEDVLKILLGLSSFEPGPNFDVLANVDSSPKGKGMDSYIESSFLYHWNPMMSQSDAAVLEEDILEIAGRTKDLHPKDFRDLHQQFKMDNFNDDPTTRNCPRLIRDARTGYFQDEDLANVILSASEDTACAPGSHQIPPNLRTFELEILEEGRAQNVCTFNEFRKLYGLNALPSFTAWNPDPEISQAAENLYGSIDRLELYPGLQAEAAIPNGLGLGYTQTYALIIDLVTRCRSDPSVLRQNDDNITAWGMSQTLVDRTRSGYGAVLPKLLQRTLPKFYPFNNMYTLFPFAVPSTFPKISTDSQTSFSDFTYDKPAMKKTHVLDNLEVIRYVFNKPDIYQNPYSRGLAKVTNGYGYLLGFENALEHLHDQDQLMTMYALIPDAGSLSRYGATFGKMTEDAIKRHRRKDGGKTTIDIVGDVINDVCTRWVCETLCDYELADDHAILSTPSKRSSARRSKVKSGQEGQKTAKEMHKEFAALYTLIFRSFDQEDGWDAQRRAIESSKRLRVHIENKIPKPKWLLSQSYNIEWLKKAAAELKEFCWDLVEIYFFQKVLPASTAQTFLERVVQASRSISLPKIHTVPHLHEKLQAKKDSTQKDQDNLEREIEVSRIVANILGLAAVTAVNYSQACAQVVDFYLQDEYQDDRAEIIRISNEVPKSDEHRRDLNAQIAKYIHEALRISQPLGLWREATMDDEIKLPTSSISVREGDLIFADFHQAHNDSTAFPNPDKVDISRPKVKSLLGVGIHRCPAFSFIDNTMPEVIRMIFQLPNLSRVQSSAHSRLNMVHVHPRSTQMDPKAFVSEKGEVAYYPQTMILEYDDPSSSENIDEKEKDFVKTWEAGQVPNPLRTITKKSEQGLAISFIFFILYKVILVLLGIWALIMLFFFGPLRRPVKVATAADIQHVYVECPEPITTWEPWTIATLPAGNVGIPQDLVYTTSLPTAHRLQLYDADKKDMRMAVHVDDILRGLTSDFELNREEDCGDDVYQCYVKQYSGGVVVVPPGNHTVRIAWAGKEFINETIPDLGENTARRILWNRDYCGPQV